MVFGLRQAVAGLVVAGLWTCGGLPEPRLGVWEGPFPRDPAFEVEPPTELPLAEDVGVRDLPDADGRFDAGPGDEGNTGEEGGPIPGDPGEDGAELSDAFSCGLGCDDGRPCTRDWCDESTGQCRHEDLPDCVPCRDGGDCIDKDGCTRDECREGRCFHEPIPIPGCVSCLATGFCDDGNNCTLGRCVGEGYCVFECNCRTVCESDEDCGTGDRCLPGRCVMLRGAEGGCRETVCVAGPAPSCDDGNPCTGDRCDPATGQCLHTPVPSCVPCAPGSSCEDGEPCTEDHCDLERGVCVHRWRSCDDGLSCTREWCEPGVGCRVQPLEDSCEADKDCRDDDPCTEERCEPLPGCCRVVPVPGCQPPNP